jgi:prepilin signal peptidase PulO-like enzyme (type II secretory pathway)
MSEGIGIVSAALIGMQIAIAAIWASDLLPRLSANARAHLPEAPSTLHLFDAEWRWLHGASLALSAGFFAYLGWRYGPNGQSLVLGGLYAFLLLITLIDVKYRLVLNVLTYPAIGLTLAVQIMLLRAGMRAALVGAGLAFSIFFLTALIRPGDLGGGDVKLAALIGLWHGFPGVLWALLVGVGVGGVATAWITLAGSQDGATQGRRIHVPYAPFLCLGALAAFLYNPIPNLLP